MIRTMPKGSQIIVTIVRPTLDVKCANHVMLELDDRRDFEFIADSIGPYLPHLLGPLPILLLPGSPVSLLAHFLFPCGASTCQSAYYGIERAVKLAELERIIERSLSEFVRKAFVILPERLEGQDGLAGTPGANAPTTDTPQ